MKKASLFFLLTVMLSACNPAAKSRLGGEWIEIMPERPAYEGFQWHRTEGAGLRFWAQNSAEVRLMADPELPGAVIVRNGDNAPRRVMQLFRLENKTIDDVIGQLREQTGWNDKETGRFQEIESDRPNVKRYVLVPTGEYGQSIQAQMQHEPVPCTCSGWGIGNSGMRYFEIHDTHPDIALFLEIGQEAPLFDERSVEITDTPDDGHLSADILYTRTGTLEIGHEVRSFTPDGVGEAYWIIDKTGCLAERYDRLTGGIKNGNPVHATLRLEYNGKWEVGLAADYAGTFFVREIIEMRADE